MFQGLLIAASYLLNGLAEFVRSTETPWDDLAVDILGVIIESEPAQDWINGMLDAPPDVEFLNSPPAQVVEAFAARNIPWEKVIQYLPQILTLVRVLLGK